MHYSVNPASSDRPLQTAKIYKAGGKAVYMKRFLLVLMAMFVLCGCSRSETARITVTPRQYETDISTVEAEELSLSGMKNSEFEEELNKKFCEELSSALVAFDTLAQESSDKVVMGNKSVFNNKWDTKRNSDEFLSLVNEQYIYLGGAHGNTAWYPTNIDAQSCAVLKLDDLFEDKGYKETLNRLITALVEENPEEYADLWEKPEIRDSHQADFYIDDSHLVIFFQPYALSYYARGFVEFPIKLEDLSGQLKEEYRRLIPNNPHQPTVTKPCPTEPASITTYTISV